MKVLEEANVSIRKERDYYSMAQMIQPDPMKPDPIIRSSQSSPRAIDTKTGRRPAPPLYKGGASYALGTEVWEQHDGIWLSVREMAETNRIAAKERIELAETQEKLTDVTIRMVEQDAELDAIKLRMKDYESQRVDAVKEGKRHATELYATDISKLLELLGKGLDATEAIEEWGHGIANAAPHHRQEYESGGFSWLGWERVRGLPAEGGVIAGPGRSEPNNPTKRQ